MNKFNIVFRIIIRLLSVLMPYFYFSAYRSQFAYQPLTFYRIMNWTTIGILCSIGLWFITTRLAKKWKKISLILYLPTLLISPMVAPGNYIVNYIISIAILIKYFPWRKTNDIST